MIKLAKRAALLPIWQHRPLLVADMAITATVPVLAVSRLEKNTRLAAYLGMPIASGVESWKTFHFGIR